MDDTQNNINQDNAMPTSQDTPPDAERVSEIATLLQSLDQSTGEEGRTSTSTLSMAENRLVQVRMGVASGLFAALECKHPPTAAHSLRVALGCSTWVPVLDLTELQRDAIEVGALLHDIGKIGVPDSLLLKPGKLTADEEAIMRRHRLMGLEILVACCSCQDVLDIVRCASAWYDGSREGTPKGNDIPKGARIVAIMDAYDSMTTDHVYRPARSHERAMADLFRGAGTQFDPDLVRHFADLHKSGHFTVNEGVARRWLKAFNPEVSAGPWELNASAEPPREKRAADGLFEKKLMGNMHDGVVFVDSQLQIFGWNHGAERLTGISASAVSSLRWAPQLLSLQDEKGRPIPEKDCPVANAVETGLESLDRLRIVGRGGMVVPIDLHAVPVMGRDGVIQGAALMMRDVSPVASLEQRCQSLHQKATKDPLTQIANRAEFDRMHELFIVAHQESNLSCSLIICDIDHFKRVNDTFGHQAGDAAIKSFADLLRNACRPGDLAARYGGEEFVLLCADCNIATAVRRADRLRKKLSQTRMPMLGNKPITASFGVTEWQPGDTPNTMLRRADRALLQAKELGRNTVIQLGTGMVREEAQRRWWPFGSKADSSSPQLQIETQLVTIVPFDVAVQKLRGFVADHNARFTATGEDSLELFVDSLCSPETRRRSDRSVPFVIRLVFSEDRVELSNVQGLPSGDQARTMIDVVISPKRNRDRRRGNTAELAREILRSLKSYLMAEEAPIEGDDKVSNNATDATEPWLERKGS